MSSTGDGPGPPGKGWYPDPAGSSLLRWWDGGAWTDDMASRDEVPVGPIPSPSVGKVLLVVVAAVAAMVASTLLLVYACLALLYSGGG